MPRNSVTANKITPRAHQLALLLLSQANAKGKRAADQQQPRLLVHTFCFANTHLVH
jgi:hypothetical protein